MSALTIEDWCDEAEARGYYLSIDRLAELTSGGHPVTLLASIEQGSRSFDDSWYGRTMTPAEYWSGNREEYSWNPQTNVGTLDGDTYEGDSDYQIRPPFYACEDTNRAMLGGGGDHSMLWSDVLRMPNIIVEDDEVDDDE